MNPASASSPSTTYTYDPSGNPSMAGASSNWPFLYQGMEHESIDPNQFYYSGNGAYYSAQIMRSMSMTSAQGTSGPGGGPGPGQASLPPVGSAPNAFDPGRRLQSAAEGIGPGLGAGGGIAALGAESVLAPYAIPIALGVAWAFDFSSFLQDLLGGSPDYPPNYFTDQFRLNRPHGGRHPLYTAFIGMTPGIVVDQKGPHCLCGDPHPCASSPLATACPGDMLCNPTPTPESAPGYPLGLGPNAIPPPKPQTGATYWSCVFRKLATVRIAECFGCIIGGGSLPESGWKGGTSTAAACGACLEIAKSCRDNPNQ